MRKNWWQGELKSDVPTARGSLDGLTELNPRHIQDRILPTFQSGKASLETEVAVRGGRSRLKPEHFKGRGRPPELVNVDPPKGNQDARHLAPILEQDPTPLPRSCQRVHKLARRPTGGSDPELTSIDGWRALGTGPDGIPVALCLEPYAQQFLAGQAHQVRCRLHELLAIGERPGQPSLEPEQA